MTSERFDKNHGVGRRFRSATLTQLNKKYFSGVLSYAENYKKYLQRGEGLLLSGPPGIGKTFAIAALLKEIKRKEGGRFDYYMVTAPRLFDIYAASGSDQHLDEHRGKSWNRVFEDVEGFCINDLGKEDRSREWQEQAAAYKLGRLLRARHEEERSIFITTNFPLKALADDSGTTFKMAYGDAIWSLVQEMTCARLQIQAPDLRERKARRDNGQLEEDDEE